MILNFLQSPQWRAFQERVGRQIYTLNNQAFFIKLDLILGKSYLYSPFLQVIEHMDEVKKIAQKENAVFLKVEPMMDAAYASEKLLKAGFKKSNKYLQPQRTVILDLRRSASELLESMHTKTRYNIRLASKKAIAVKKSVDKLADFENFWKLLEATARRDNFSIHAKNYYEELLMTTGVQLYLAYKGSELVAGAIVIFYEERTTYLHGASNYQQRALMAPYLLHWQIIQDAASGDMKEYDFWGINETRWPGITRFKRGFGGREVEYTGSYDYTLQKFWYKLYKFKNEIIN